MSALGRPLAVYSATAECDGPGRHEARLITDGNKAYGYLLGLSATDLGDAAVATSSMTPRGIEWVCPGDGEECGGYFLADLAAGDGWTADLEVVEALVEYGTEVQR